MKNKRKGKNKLYKKEKGITLVALVLTIIVLIILATVAINFAFGQNGIISQAEKGRDYYSNDYTHTDGSLANAEAYLDTVMYGDSWRYDSNGNVTNGTITLEIGDYIDYDCTTNDETYTSYEVANGYGDQTFTASDYSYGWRVLGIDEGTGELLILSEDFVPLTGGRIENKETYYCLLNQAGYTNGVNELNKICEIYGKGKGATGGRSITVEDVNKITGYNPNNVGVYDPEKKRTGIKYMAGTDREYGNKVTYYWDGTEFPYYECTNGVTGSLTESHNNGFAWYDSSSGWQLSPKSSTASTNAREEITTLESSHYYYFANTLTVNSEDPAVGIDQTSEKYKTLFIGERPYWLASQCVYANYNDGHDNTMLTFNLRNVSNVGTVGSMILYTTTDVTSASPQYCGIRPVVSLNTEITLTDSGTERDGCTLWNIG